MFSVAFVSVSLAFDTDVLNIFTLSTTLAFYDDLNMDTFFRFAKNCFRSFNTYEATMSYLDEFVEEIQGFLSDLRCELNFIRELNLQLPNDKDELEKQASIFFQNASTMSFEKRDSTFQSLLSKYENILEVADKKVNIIQWLEKMLSDCLENLDREITKVKVELEVENPGITTTIEDKFLTNARITSKRITQILKKNIKKKRVSKSIFKLGADKIAEIIKQLQQEFGYNSAEIYKDTIDKFSVESGSNTSLLNCICNQPAFGDMISCMNKLCPYKSFHYACMYLRTAPVGKWCCPKCTVYEVYLERI